MLEALNFEHHPFNYGRGAATAFCTRLYHLPAFVKQLIVEVYKLLLVYLTLIISLSFFEKLSNLCLLVHTIGHLCWQVIIPFNVIIQFCFELLFVNVAIEIFSQNSEQSIDVIINQLLAPVLYIIELGFALLSFGL